MDIGNLRFSQRVYKDPIHLIDVSRISDNHWLPEQMWFDHELDEDEIRQAAEHWMEKHPGLDPEPAPTHCLACDAILESDADTNYQFDNVLWIALYGGYGMFVDNDDFPTNTEDRWLLNEDGSPLLEDGKVVEDQGWEPEYEEPRLLPGRPDYEAVICHECAHEMWEKLPWLAKLIPSHNSHAHRTAYLQAHPDHRGWDTDATVP